MKSTKIKIIGLFAIAVLYCTNGANAQNSIRFGIKGGLNVSNLITSDVNTQNALYGYNAGVFLKLPLNNYFSLQPELLYTTKGAELNYNNSYVTGTGRFAINYFELPVLVVINLTKDLNIQGGAYAASLTDATAKNIVNGTFDFAGQINKDNFNTLDYGLIGGIGLDMGQTNLSIRYEYGLQTIGKQRSFSGVNYIFPNAHNSTLQANISFSIF